MNKIKTRNTKRYDEIAKEYNKDWRGKLNEDRVKDLQSFEKILGFSPKRILDAGCGTGRDCIYFASHGYEVHGIDLSQGMLEQGIKKAKEKKLKINFSIKDMQSTNFSRNSFVGIWTASALVHLKPAEKRKTIQEFYRILKPNGVIYINVQNFLSLKHLMRFFQSYFLYLKHSNDTLIQKMRLLRKRIKNGYALIDERHWFYPTKFFLLKLLKEKGFVILKSNNLFSRRLIVFAKKNDN